MSDPFDALARPVEPVAPRPSFARDLRSRIVSDLGLDAEDAMPVVPLPERRAAMPRSTTAPTVATALTPYLAVSDGLAALAFYADVFGAVEELRVVGDDGRIGHAEVRIGDVRLMLADEYPEIGVLAPPSLGGTSVTLHLTVNEVDDLFEQAVAAGAVAQREPADQPHGNRIGVIVDPFGHRWMLSQAIEAVDAATYRARSEGSGYTVAGADEDHVVISASEPGTGGGIWAAVHYDDALGAIRFLVDVFGFEEQLVVVGADGRTVVHSQLRWPEGGVVQVGTYDPANLFSRPPGDQSLYVVTTDPQSVWERCEREGLPVVRAPHAPDHDPQGMGFTVRDQVGNLWSFGTYGLGLT